MSLYLGIFIAGALFCFLITPLVMRLGFRFRVYGHSHGGRVQAMLPRLGGLGVFLAVVLAAALVRLVPLAVQDGRVLRWDTLTRLLLPATLVLLLGIYDDVAGALPWQKLLIEFFAAGIAWWAGIRIAVLPVLGYAVHSLPLSFLLTVFWLLAVTNAFNLIDGLDGLAAGIAFFVALALFMVALIQADSPVCLLAVAVAGALLGFLWYNSVPARIFLGDTGSLFLGFLLGALAVSAAGKSPAPLSQVVPYLAFGVPLLDTSLAVVRRLLSGRSVLAADCGHLHHKLLQAYASPWLAVGALYYLAALFSIGSLLILRSTHSVLLLAAVLGGVTAWFLATQVRYEELAELGELLGRGLWWQRRVLANQILIREASRKLEKSSNLGKSWEVLATTLQALGFEVVQCRLKSRPDGLFPALPACRNAGARQPERVWSASIPLRVSGESIGVLLLQRDLAKGRLLFQFSSLLQTLIPAFERRLRAAYEARPLSPAVDYNLQVASQLESGVLADSRGEA